MAARSDAVAEELYRLAPGDFTAERDARALDARRAGERQLAKEIKALRRPSTSAWMTNWLARECSIELGQLLELGDALRAAQHRLEGEELRRLSRRRQEVLVALSARARAAALALAVPVSEDAVRDLHDTLNAAAADPEAAAAVLSGRLTTALHHSGFGLPGTGDQSGDPSPSPAQATKTVTSPPAQPDFLPDHPGSRHRLAEASAEQERSDEREAARSALRQAESEAADVRLRLEQAGERVARAQHRHDTVAASISELEAQLEVLRREEGATALELDDAQQARETLREVCTVAEDRLAECRHALEGHPERRPTA